MSARHVQQHAAPRDPGIRSGDTRNLFRVSKDRRKYLFAGTSHAGGAQRGRAFCDAGFLDAMKRSCTDLIDAAFGCGGRAYLYYAGVRVLGEDYYE
jgi:hypothetical protein